MTEWSGFLIDYLKLLNVATENITSVLPGGVLLVSSSGRRIHPSLMNTAVLYVAPVYVDKYH